MIQMFLGGLLALKDPSQSHADSLWKSI